jgi:hypothetical protein
MPFTFKYLPVLRSRQQELIVLDNFDFEEGIYPLLEIIKEKDRINNSKTPQDIWLGHIGNAHADHVLVDLPVYIRDTSSMQDDVLSFNRTMLSNIERRIAFFESLAPARERVIPVISSLLQKTGEVGTINTQIQAARNQFDTIAIRTFTSSFDNDFAEIQAHLAPDDILIYDMDTAQPLNPLVKRHKTRLDALRGAYKVAIRSAINTEIQNIKLAHGEVVPDADNSLLEVFQSILGMNAFGDYAGIKKDDLNAGGTISPGFIFYDPLDNLYYGFKGEVKNLSEFESTIVPAVLGSDIVHRILTQHPSFLSKDNAGYQQLLAIQAGTESGKSQAKFKRISMEHYLHCIRTMIREGSLD